MTCLPGTLHACVDVADGSDILRRGFCEVTDTFRVYWALARVTIARFVDSEVESAWVQAWERLLQWW